MALRTSYPVGTAVGVGPPGTSLASYGLLGKMGLSAPYTPMVGSSTIGWKPPIHGGLSGSSTSTTGSPTPVSTGGFVSGIPGGSTLLGGSGIPMPVVPGYKYVYPWYRWQDATSAEDAHYKLVGHKEDRDAFAYFPYFPGKGVEERAYDSGGSALKDMLVGVSLIRS